MRRAWFLLSIAAGCADEATAPTARLPLDQALAPGAVRAGRIEDAREVAAGAEARARPGDFKLYNARVQVYLGRVDDGRGYSPYGGGIIDADVVRPDGSLRSAFGEWIRAVDFSVHRPKSIEVTEDGASTGRAVVRVKGELGPIPIFDGLISGLFGSEHPPIQVTTDYILEADAEAVRVETELHNPTDEALEVGLVLSGFLMGQRTQPFVPGFGFRVPNGGEKLEFFAGVSPAISYLIGDPEVPYEVIITQSGISVVGSRGPYALEARDRRKYVEWLLIGAGGPSELVKRWRALRGEPQLTRLTGAVRSEAGAAIDGARVHVRLASASVPEQDYVTRAVTGADGEYELWLAPGEYLVEARKEGHAATPSRRVVVTAEPADVDFVLPASGVIAFEVKDQDGSPLPVKITVVGSHEPAPSSFGEPREPGGVLRTHYALDGKGELSLPAGDYRVIASRGTEYEILDRSFRLAAGGREELAGVLTRVIQSPGWVSTDTHLHANLSPDSPDAYPKKVSALVVEGLEMPISTDHEFIGDFNPAIAELGLEKWIKGVVGSEITTYVYGHFNAWPLVADLTKPGNGRISWYKKAPAETFAAIRANPGAPFIQVNHPRSASIGGYFSAMAFDAGGFSAGRGDEFSMDFDGIEVANGCGIGSVERVMGDWFAFLNQGYRIYGLGSTDNHHASSGDLGIPRTYLRVGSDDPRAVSVDAFARATKQGELSIACGIYLQLTSGEQGIGGLVAGVGKRKIRVVAQAPSWVTVRGVEVLVDGEIRDSIDVEPSEEVVRFDRELELELAAGRDHWVLVRARGDVPMGPWASGATPYAFTNPIFFDGDGDGKFGRDGQPRALR